MSGNIELDEAAERPIDSDALGAVGEGRFSTICAGAQLICNQGHRDRTGWDFIVEWPIDHNNSDLDKRSNPISSHFQLKSMWYDNEQIKFRMTSLERLAKDPKPSFVYITKFDHNLNPTKTLLCHMIGENLSVVLKKLRELKAAGKQKINKEYLYLSASKLGEPIGLDGKALREAVEQAIGPDIESYNAEKVRQLAELGYEPFRNSVSFKLSLQNEEDFYDAVIGLKKEIPFNSAVNTETRYGIALRSLTFPTKGAISFAPTPRDTCSIIVRRGRFDVIANFDAVILAAPSLRDRSKLGKISIKSQLFALSITDQYLNFSSIEIEPDHPKIESAKWINWYRFLKELTVSGCSIDIVPKRLKKQKLTFSKNIEAISTDQCREALKILGDIDYTVKSACGSASIVYGHAAISRNAESSRVCAALVRGDDDLVVNVDLGEKLPNDAPDRLYGRFIDAIVLDDQAIIAIASATFVFTSSDICDSVAAQEFTIEDLEVISIENLHARVKNLQSDQNVRVNMVRTLSDAPDSEQSNF